MDELERDARDHNEQRMDYTEEKHQYGYPGVL